MTYYLAVEDSNAGIATVLQYTAPVMIMVLLALKNWKLPGKNEILALILAFGGTVLLATHGNLTQLSVSKTTLIFGLSSAVAAMDAGGRYYLGLAMYWLYCSCDYFRYSDVF